MLGETFYKLAFPVTASHFDFLPTQYRSLYDARRARLNHTMPLLIVECQVIE
jgi:hypothetical protein